MSVTIACPTCNRKIRMPENLAGRQVKCPACNAPFIVPEIPAAPDPPVETLPVAPIDEPPPFEAADATDGAGFHAAARRPRRASGGFGDFLAFRTMITPVVIQILFWIYVGLFILAGLYWIFIGLMALRYSALLAVVYAALGLFTMLIGPVVVRVFCELIILQFRNNELLADIKHNTEGVRKGD
jgi:hypothetical protein